MVYLYALKEVIFQNYLIFKLVMGKTINIQLKAAFLLIVFGLNTMIGFACAMGVDMGFNTTHHVSEATEIHEHTDGVKHEHHNQAARHKNEEKKTEKEEKKDCCTDDVQKLQSLDKAVNQNAKTVIDVPVFTAIISIFLGIEVYDLSKIYPPKYRVSFFYPPPPDIRVAIQSFQI